MALQFNNTNYTCNVSNISNNGTTLSCVPKRIIENFALVANPATLGWYQIAGTISGIGQPTNVFTTDQNWSVNNTRIPSNYATMPAFQLLAATTVGSHKVIKIEPAGTGLKLTLDRNLPGRPNTTGTFWFKHITLDPSNMNKILFDLSNAAFTAVGTGPY